MSRILYQFCAMSLIVTIAACEFDMKIQTYKNISNGEACIVNPSSITDFPSGPFTKVQLQKGAIAVYIFLAIYSFICLAFICDKYFLPTIERICKMLNISTDVAATTFMATATTMPEFFTNTVSTFIAESDMGLSAIIGSAMFNTLGVAACASFFAKKPIQIDWWPLARDSLLLIIIILVLDAIVWDSIIMWWETCILVSLYIFYWIVMFQNKRIMGLIKRIVEDHLRWCQRIKNYDIENQRPKADNAVEKDGNIKEIPKVDECTNGSEPNEIKIVDDIWNIPVGSSKTYTIWFFFTWPIRFLLHFTIPDPLKYKNLFPVSFIICIIWIGSASYVVFWMVVTVGDTFDIPESVMGISALAFGGCMPEAISAVIVARKGSGQLGVSNALGANCLAILFSLGLPWFISTMIKGAGWTDSKIIIYSYGMEYTVLILILAVIALYGILAFHGYKLRVKVGVYLSISYILIASFAILMEYNIFLVGAPADC